MVSISFSFSENLYPTCNSRILTDLSWARKERKNFLYDCNQQERRILDFVLGSEYEELLVNQFKNLGRVSADRRNGKILVDLFRVRRLLLIYIKWMEPVTTYV